MSIEAKVIELADVAIRFSGDSGDGMQLTGSLFSDASAILGNDISTFPDFPAEIRAPQGTVAGVSGFQVHLGNQKVHTPGDKAHVLIAMNPAAIKANASNIKAGGTIIYDKDSFTEKNFAKANIDGEDVFEACHLYDYARIGVPITSLTKECLKDLDLDNKSILRSKNMFALGLVCWIFNRPLNYIEDYIKGKFAKKPLIAEANVKVLNAGFNYGLNLQHTTPRYIVHPAPIEKGHYRNINGNSATAWGLLAAGKKADRPIFIGSYPITPATEVFQELAARKDMGVKSVQAEDEIAGICTSIGASFAGNFAVTSTSGPGLALKSEAIGLAIMSELPLVIVNVQRGGPSTGLPTKPEQSDLLQALYGRNGESPLVVLAASSPADCFDSAYLAGKISMERMIPVMLLTDGFLGNGRELWKVPKMDSLASITPPIALDCENYEPYGRDEQTLAREWSYPGMKGFEHHIGGLEKDIKGDVSHDADNHDRMTQIRAEKVARVVDMIPDQEVYGDETGDVLVVGWGGTYGHLVSAVREMREEGKNVSLAHFKHILPLPANTSDVFSRYKKIVICELNLGQFASYLRDKLPQFEYAQVNKVKGQPFAVSELKEEIGKYL